jgi:predicted dehydrogenase
VDQFHDTYIVEALDAGRNVITEKPMAVDASSCAKILEAVQRNDGTLTVTFNYRYDPVHEKVRELLARGEIGEIGSVHLEWLLDVRYGDEYFRDNADSVGLLVHKATNHFDLLNWWIGSMPDLVYADGRLFLHGGAGVSIEDDLGVMVRYANGVNLTYHLTAYSPWAGYRLMVNGSKGRLELEVVENDHVSHAEGQASPEAGWATLTVHPFWHPPFAVPLEHTMAGHGGADARMLQDIFRPREDPLRRKADHRDGALSLLTGFAAGQSCTTGEPVKVADVLDLR